MNPKSVSSLKQAIRAIEYLKSKVNEQYEPIAVIGLGCRFPGGANDAESFWQLLSEGKDAVKEVPPNRWDVEAYYDPNPEII